MTPKEWRLETPPDGDEGEIRDVEFGHVDERYAGTPKACQACESAVDRDEPHVWVHGHQETPSGLTAHFRAVFCDRDCWTDWASRK